LTGSVYYYGLFCMFLYRKLGKDGDISHPVRQDFFYTLFSTLEYRKIFRGWEKNKILFSHYLLTYS
jgi:hypothetical protein